MKCVDMRLGDDTLERMLYIPVRVCICLYIEIEIENENENQFNVKIVLG